MKTYEELQEEIIALNAKIAQLNAELTNVADAILFITDPINVL